MAKITQQTVAAWRRNPMSFVMSLTIPGASGDVRFGDAMAEHQVHDFRHMLSAVQSIAQNELPRVRNLWIERTKKSRRSSVCGCCCSQRVRLKL